MKEEANGSNGSDRPGYDRVDNVQDPVDPEGKRRTFAWMGITEFKRVKIHNKWKAHNVRSVPFVLENPDRIFRHIRQHEEEEDPGYCYSRLLTRAWTKDGKPCAPREGTVFCVYLRSGMTIFDWRADENDPEDPRSPAGAKEGMGSQRGRFGVLVWERK